MIAEYSQIENSDGSCTTIGLQPQFVEVLVRTLLDARWFEKITFQTTSMLGCGHSKLGLASVSNYLMVDTRRYLKVSAHQVSDVREIQTLKRLPKRIG